MMGNQRRTMFWVLAKQHSIHGVRVEIVNALTSLKDNHPIILVLFLTLLPGERRPRLLGQASHTVCPAAARVPFGIPHPLQRASVV